LGGDDMLVLNAVDRVSMLVDHASTPPSWHLGMNDAGKHDVAICCPMSSLAVIFTA
jgi:hypothetical protein